MSFICPYPLVHFESFPAHTQTLEVFDGSGCAIPCPTLDFSSNRWTRLKRSLSVMILLAFLSSGGVLISHLVDKRRIERNYYRIMFSIGFFSYSFIIGLFMILNRNDEIICDSSAHYIPKGKFCIFQAASTIWFMTWTEIWLLNLVYDLYCKVADSSEDIFSQRTRLKRCTLIGLIVPTIVTAVPCIGNNIGFDYEANIPICLYLVSTTNAYFWYSFMIPLYFLLLVSMAVMIACAWRIHRIFINSKHYQTALSGDREIVAQNLNVTVTDVGTVPPSEMESEQFRYQSQQSQQLLHQQKRSSHAIDRLIESDAGSEGGDESLLSIAVTDANNRNSFDCLSFNCPTSSEASYFDQQRQSLLPYGEHDTDARVQQKHGHGNEHDVDDHVAVLQSLTAYSYSYPEMWSEATRPSYSMPSMIANRNECDGDDEDREHGAMVSVDFSDEHGSTAHRGANANSQSMASSHKSYSVSQRIRNKLVITKDRMQYLRAIWVYHRRSIFFVIIFTVMALSQLYYIYQLFAEDFDVYVDSAEDFVNCLVVASLSCVNQTQTGVDQCAQQLCPSYPFPEKIPNIVEVNFVIGWIAAYAVIPSIILGFNGKLSYLSQLLYSKICGEVRVDSREESLRKKLITSTSEQ